MSEIQVKGLLKVSPNGEVHGVGEHSRNKIDQVLSSGIVKPIIVHQA